MRDDGSYTDSDWEHIYGEGGAGVVPGAFSIDYQPPAFKPYPSAWIAWFVLPATVVFVLPVLIAVPIAIRAALKGNRLAWLAAAANLVAVPLCFWLWSVPRSL